MEERIGKVIHYYNRISVAVIELSSPLKVGDMVHVLGKKTDFTQTVESMQLEHENITAGKVGESVAVRVNQEVREGDAVYVVKA